MDAQVTEASGQMSEAPMEPNTILGFPGTGYSGQKSPNMDAEIATVEKANEECCQEPQNAPIQVLVSPI